MLLSPSCDKSHRMRWTTSVLGLAILASSLFLAVRARAHGQSTPAPQIPPQASSTPTQTPKATSLVGAMALRFEPNQGQTDGRVRFLSRDSRYNLFLTDDEAVFALNGPPPEAKNPNPGRPVPFANLKAAKHAVVRMRLVGAHPKAVTASQQLPGEANYFIGRDPKNWVHNVPQYSRVNYVELYPGVDMTFYGSDRTFEFDLILKPGADAHQIALRFAGARKVSTDKNGDLVLSSAAGDLALRKPVAYQSIDGVKKPVDVRFAARRRNEIGFALGAYDLRRELVIDPTVLYSTYLGGNGSDVGQAVAVDSNGAIYLTGETGSSNFPITAGAAQSTLAGSTDVFVTKFTPDGSALVYSTYLGGSDQQGGDTSVGPTSSGNTIAVDGSYNVYIAGGTNTSDFPLCPPANNCPAPAQSAYAGGKNDAFVVRLNPTGGLAYSTFIGGSDVDIAEGIAIDSSGNIYIGGQTQSSNLQVVQPLQGLYKGGTDGFVAKIDGTAGSATLGQFKYLDYLGGSGADLVSAIGLDGLNNIYVTGITDSTDFPVHGATPFQKQCGSNGQCDPNSSGTQSDAFFTAIKSNLSEYIYSTYFGGNGADGANTLVVDSVGNAYAAGFTDSTNLAVTPKAYQPALNKAATLNAFVAELDPTGSTAKYVTYLGGSSSEAAFGIALDSTNRIYLTGPTTSVDFPIVAPFQNILGGASDAFVSLLDPSRSGQGQLVYSTYFGGTGKEDTQLAGIAIDSKDNIYFTGDTASSSTASPPFYISPNAYQPTISTPPDAFLTKISSTTTPTPQFTVDVTNLTPDAISIGSSATATITVTSQNGFAGNVSLSCRVAPPTTAPPTCSLQPVIVAVPANGTVQSSLTIATVSPSASFGLAGLWLPLVGLAVMVPGLKTSKRRQQPYFLALCVVLTALLLMPGCVSGSGTSGGGGTTGTTKGTYHFTLQGTDQGMNSPSITQTFTVQ
jgi:Beta-propeller repeat